MELKFLSTLSLRRATPIGSTDICVACDFYPRSPCGERQRSIRCHAKNLTISIHALLAESDAPMAFIAAQRSRFLSTLSLRRATKKGSGKSTTLTNFYPRSPCGERLQYLCGDAPYPYFYPRSPCGERLFASRTLPLPLDFYPRSPCGERPKDNTI